MRSRLIPIFGLLIGGGALLAGLVSIAIGEKGPNTAPIEGSSEVQRSIAGIPQEGAELGSSTLAVTISLFNDLQCESCARYQMETVPPLIEDLIRPGEAKLELRHFSLGTRRIQVAALAAAAAGEQDAQWQYAQLFAMNIGKVGPAGVTDQFLERVAAGVPGPTFDVTQWRGDFASPAVASLVDADAGLATEHRFPADPAVVVDGPGGTRELISSPTLEEIEGAVAEVSAPLVDGG